MSERTWQRERPRLDLTQGDRRRNVTAVQGNPVAGSRADVYRQDAVAAFSSLSLVPTGVEPWRESGRDGRGTNERKEEAGGV